MEHKLSIRQCQCINGFSYPYARTLLDAVMKLKEEREFFLNEGVPTADEKGFFTPLGALLVSMLVVQIPSTCHFSGNIEDNNYAVTGDMSAYFETATKLLATFE